jgi:hypothetical protein
MAGGIQLRAEAGTNSEVYQRKYALCEEYQQVDLWAAYYAFRLDPQARTWERLRRRNIPWQREQTVEALLHRLCPLNGKRTPDPATVDLAMVTHHPFRQHDHQRSARVL